MAMDDYGPPVDQLKKLGDVARTQIWADYRALGLGPGDVPELARMAADRRWDDVLDGDPAGWSPIHAWRALGQLRAEEAVGPLVAILADQKGDDWNDWATEEVPEVLGMIGPAAIPELRSRLEGSPTLEEFEGSYYARALPEIARRHPEARDECVAILTRALDDAERNDPGLNAYLIDNLMDLEAEESAGSIERAFAGRFVDESITGSWYEVWHEMGLEGDPPPKPEWVRTPRSTSPELDPDDLDFDPDDYLVEPYHEPPLPSWTPSDVRPPEERKDRNKARQKLEKKAKGKKGKKR